MGQRPGRGMRFQPVIEFSLAEVRVSRTHRRPLRTTTGFEDREDHRSLSTSSFAVSIAMEIATLNRLCYLNTRALERHIGCINDSAIDTACEGRRVRKQAGARLARRSAVEIAKANRSKSAGRLRDFG